MIAQKFIPFRGVFAFAGFHLIWLAMYSALIAVLYKYAGWDWIVIPWVSIALIGTAVAFYLGFKNSQAYDRMWEARKIWGGIVNSSRSWGAMVNSFVSNSGKTEKDIASTKAKLIYRHIAWLYTLREQLLVPTSWEHVSLARKFGSINVERRKNFGVGQFSNYLNEVQKNKYFTDKELWEKKANGATQIISMQSSELKKLLDENDLDLFHQIKLQETLNEFYVHQGQAERIKKFPFPRQFANSSFLLNSIFIMLLPLGLAAEFAKLGEYGVWLMIPFATLVSWVFIVMELVGDYSENPFEGLMHDIPMLSICRTIEIDLLQIIGDNDVPQPIQPVKNILM